MNLYEFQGKELFKKFGIPVPDGYVIQDPKEIRDDIFPVALKSQVLVGGRGKAGGIKFADNKNDAIAKATELFSQTIKGSKVKYILVERKLNIDKELYISITIDRGKKRPLVMASAEGGVEIETVEESKIYMHWIDPLIGYSPYLSKMVSKKLNLNSEQSKQLSNLLKNMYTLFQTYDCELVEINPLVITKEGNIIAADSKVIVDSDSLFRHKDVPVNLDDLTDLERIAKMQDYSFVELDGDIGVIANGAGLTMATLDSLLLHGLKPRNFLDLGGTDSVDIVKNAFPLVLKAQPKIIFVNIFGGVTKCDTVAQGIVLAKKEYNINLPIVVRLNGVHEEEGRQILKDNGIDAFATMPEGVAKVAEIYKGVH
ncbi:MAG: ADP-forming succinate--CoA ligase subunit beta [Thermoplasmata archaeon]|nr:ADP-forming succinate--CoA ligase subunit beta [Thermoplasmata archaeon]